MFNTKFKKAQRALNTEIEYAKHMAYTYMEQCENEPSNESAHIQYDYWRGRRDAMIELKDKINPNQ